MTTPELSGYPDWQPHPVWQHPLSYNTDLAVTSGGTNNALFGWTSSYGAMMIRLRVTGIGARVRLEHSALNGDANLVTTNEWHLRVGTEVQAVVPLVSNLLGLACLGSLGGNSTVQVRAQQLNSHTDRIHYLGRNTVMSINNVNIPAASNVMYTPIQIVPGPAALWMNNPAAGSALVWDFWTKDHDNTLLQKFNQFGATNGQERSMIELPPSLWTLSVTNLAGAAQAHSFGLVMRGSVT